MFFSSIFRLSINKKTARKWVLFINLPQILVYLCVGKVTAVNEALGWVQTFKFRSLKFWKSLKSNNFTLKMI